MFMTREAALPRALQEPTNEATSTNHEAREHAHPSVSSMWRSTVVVQSALGLDEVFSIGPDGMVWNFAPQIDKAGAYRLKNMHMAADELAVGRDGSGRLVVFAADGLVLRYRCETAGGQLDRWTQPRRVLLPAIRGAQRIKRVSCESIAKLLLVGVTMSVQAQDGSKETALAVSVWEQDGPVFRDAAGFSETSPDGRINRFVSSVITPR